MGDLPVMLHVGGRRVVIAGGGFTTNGMLMPAQASDLAAAGLDRVTVSLDSLDESGFAALSGGRGSVAGVLAGIDAARAAGLGPVKVNVVIKRGANEESILSLARHFHGHRRRTVVGDRTRCPAFSGRLRAWHATQGSRRSARRSPERSVSFFRQATTLPVRPGESGPRFSMERPRLVR